MRNIDSNLTELEDENLKKLVKKERYQILRKKVFSIPFFTMLGIWILVYYQFMSHFHYFPMDYSSFIGCSCMFVQSFY